jgi:glycerophosphoryl diester phosphodiesterase
MQSTFLFLLAVTLMSITTLHAEQTKKPLQPLFISHRGESKDAPENTMGAYKLSQERNVDGFELDAILTLDRKEIFCFHDDNMKRCTGVEKRSREIQSWDEIKDFNAGAWKKKPEYAEEKIPTLKQALALAKRERPIFIHAYFNTNALPRFKEILSELPNVTKETIVVISFDGAIFKGVKEILPGCKTYLLSSMKIDKTTGKFKKTAAQLVEQAKKHGADGISVEGAKGLDPAFFKTIQNAGLSTHVWTIDDFDLAKHFADMGVDSITSNCAAELMKAFRNTQSSMSGSL